MDIGVLNDHVIVVSLVVVAVHKLTPVLHRQTEETLNHLREKELGEKLVQNTIHLQTRPKGERKVGTFSHEHLLLAVVLCLAGWSLALGRARHDPQL